MLSRNSSVARWGSTQPFARVESKRLLKLFCVFSDGCTVRLSLRCTTRALAFVADEEDLGHSLAVCPTPPQNRQVLLLNWHVHSACVSFPSLPSLSERSGFFFSELLNELA